MTSALGQLTSPLAGRATGLVTTRTLLVGLMPMLAFWVAATVLIGTQLGWQTVHHKWDQADSEHRVLAAVLTVAVVAGSAAMLSAAERRIALLYRGECSTRVLERCRCLGAVVSRQKTKRRELSDAENANEHRLYPPAEKSLAATGLGNILRAAECYPDRYKLNGVLWWPRFYMVVPDVARADLSAALASMTMRLHMSAMATLFVGLTGVAAAVFYTANRSASGLLWSVAAAAAAIVSSYCYARAREAALIYADLIRTTFDLHRAEVLNRMGFALPETLEAERQLWDNLNKLLAFGGVDTGGDALLDAARARYLPKPRSTD